MKNVEKFVYPRSVVTDRVCSRGRGCTENRKCPEEESGTGL